MAGPLFNQVRALEESIRAREFSVVDVVEAHLAQIEKHNPQVNGVVTLDAEGARRQAKEADAKLERGDLIRPLHGIPFTVKDTYQTAGISTSSIAMKYAVHVPDQNATLVQRLVDAGAILLGKTNLPAASYDWQTQNGMFGRCSNPYDLSRTVGGSSGGPAAAIAAGMSNIELGSDVAGSIRVPASFCGVAGLRPTEGLLSTAGHGMVPGHPQVLDNLVSVGPMARTVEDLQLVLPFLLGADPRDEKAAPEGRLPKPSAHPVGRLRLAWASDLCDVPVSSAVSSSMAELRARLVSLGTTIEDDRPPIDWERAQVLWGQIQGAEVVRAYPAPFRWHPFRWVFRSGIVGAHFGRSGFSRGLAQGLACTKAAYGKALARRQQLMLQSETFLREWDAWICPVAPVTAFSHRRTGRPIEIDDQPVAYSRAMGAYSCPITLFGCPVATVRIGEDDQGLPIGVQIVGSRWSDLEVLRIAGLIENLTGGFRPPMGFA
jgi:amidase